MENCYVDTSAWVSLADRADQSHGRVAAVLAERAGKLVTGAHVVHETWAVMLVRHSWRAAESLVRQIQDSSTQVETSGAEDLRAAATIALAFPDQQFSLSDRTSWALMERLGIRDVVALDRDFRIYRFGVDRRRHFNVLP